MPVYKEKAQFINKKDTIRLGDFARTILLELLDSNPQNLVALDYLLCTDLTTGDIGSFKSDYDRYCMDRNAPRIKPLYQQALLIYMAGTQATNEEIQHLINHMSGEGCGCSCDDCSSGCDHNHQHEDGCGCGHCH